MEAAGHPVEWIKKWRVIARILDLERVAHSEGLKGWEKAAIRLIGGHRPPKGSGPLCLREYRPDDLDSCLGLLNRYQDTVRLALVWDRESLAPELDYPGVYNHSRQRMLFEDLGGKKVEADFNDGEVTSDAGVLFLRETDRTLRPPAPPRRRRKSRPPALFPPQKPPSSKFMNRSGEESDVVFCYDCEV